MSEFFYDFKSLKNKIINPLIDEIQKIDNSIRYDNSEINISRQPFTRIYNRLKEYKDYTLSYMDTDKLDRHKLSACICGAIVMEKPLIRIGKNTQKSIWHYNEFLGIYAGLQNMRPFTITSFLEHNPEYMPLKNDILLNYKMGLPKTIICDKKEYMINLLNALHRTMSYPCSYKDNSLNCDKFDIWAYAKLYYHIEIHNLQELSDFCKIRLSHPERIT